MGRTQQSQIGWTTRVLSTVRTTIHARHRNAYRCAETTHRNPSHRRVGFHIRKPKLGL